MILKLVAVQTFFSGKICFVSRLLAEFFNYTACNSKKSKAYIDKTLIYRKEPFTLFGGGMCYRAELALQPLLISQKSTFGYANVEDEIMLCILSLKYLEE